MVLDDEKTLGWILSIRNVCTTCNGTYYDAAYPSIINIWTSFNIKHTSRQLISDKIAMEKNTLIIKGIKSYLKMRGKLYSTKMHTWIPIQL